MGWRKHWEPNADAALSMALPQLYRDTCHHLALAKSRRYTAPLIARLNHLVVEGHHRIYQQSARYRSQWFTFFTFDFPQALRRNVQFIKIATAAFLLPGLIMWGLCFTNEEIIYSVMGLHPGR